MRYKLYTLVIRFIVYGFKIVYAIIGHNIRPAEENEYPSIACIARYDPTRSWQHNMLCSGTLITHNFILTAEHCFEGAQNYRHEISIGSHYVQSGQRDYPVWWISYDQWAALNTTNIVSNTFNDILLIKIFGVLHNIVPSPVVAIEPENLMHGLDVEMIGCGKLDDGLFPQVKQVAHVKIISRPVCGEIISIIQGSAVHVNDIFTCSVGVPWTQLGFGDSGGPLMYYGIVIGVNIAVCPKINEEFHPNKINIHMNINKYKQFLNQLADTDI